jgi:hypothetical protein
VRALAIEPPSGIRTAALFAGDPQEAGHRFGLRGATHEVAEEVLDAGLAPLSQGSGLRRRFFVQAQRQLHGLPSLATIGASTEILSPATMILV